MNSEDDIKFVVTLTQINGAQGRHSIRVQIRKGVRTMKIKRIIILTFLLMVFFNSFGQTEKKTKNTIGIDILSSTYSRDFIIKEKWSFGVEIGAGLWGGRYAFTPLSYTYCDQGCTTEQTRFIGEMFKLKPYIRVNYLKNNYIDIGLHASSTLLKPIFWDTNADATLNFATGLDVSVVYGWERVKFGTALQADYIGRYDSQNSGTISDGQFALLWAPVKIIFLF